MGAMGDECRAYWGHSACGLPRGHDPEQQVRTHRQLEPSEQAATAEDAFLYGEDLTAEERRLVAELWD